MSNTLTRQVAYNTVVQVASKGITTIIGVLTLGLLTRYLGAKGYGEYTTIFAFLGFFAVIADFGLFSIIVREIAKRPEDKEKIFGNILALRIVLALTILVLPPLVAYFIPQYNMNIKTGIAIGAFSSFFILINQAMVAIFQVNLKMDRFVVSDTVGRAVILALIYYLIKIDLGFTPIIFANAIGNLITVILSLALASTFIKIRLYFDWKYWRWVFMESLALGLVVILGLIYFRTGQVILSLFRGSIEVGIYGAPYKILEILITIPAIFIGSVFPIISRYLAANDQRLESALQKSFDFLALMAFPVVVGVFMTARPVMLLLAGPEFIASVLPLQILIFAIGIIFFGTLAGNAIIAASLQKKLLKVYIASVIFNITANLIFIPLYSYHAAATITVLTEVWACSAAYFIVWKNLNWRPRFGYALKTVISALIMAGVVYVLKNNNLLLQVTAGAASYILTLSLLGGINKDMIKMVSGRVR